MRGLIFDDGLIFRDREVGVRSERDFNGVCNLNSGKKKTKEKREEGRRLRARRKVAMLANYNRFARRN